MAYVCLHAAVQYMLLFFSTGGKFQPVSNFMELHALTPATRSYALLRQHIECHLYLSWTVVLPRYNHIIYSMPQHQNGHLLGCAYRKVYDSERPLITQSVVLHFQ